MTIDARQNWKKASRYRVKLNGLEMPHAFYADGRRGIVRVFDLGLRAVFAGDTSWLPTKELRGKVSWARL